MKSFLKFIILLFAAYGAYCFYNNYLKSEPKEEVKAEETVTTNEKTTKTQKSKRNKTSSQGETSSKQAETQSSESTVSAPASTADNDEFEEEVEEATFIPKTR